MSKTLREVILPEDLDKLMEATKKQHIQHMLSLVVRRLPEPRAYLSEPPCAADGSYPLIWEKGTDVLTAKLLAHGVSIVDPATMRFLMSWPAYVLEHSKEPDRVPFPILDAAHDLAKVAADLDPMLWPLMCSQAIQQIWVADDSGLAKRQEQIRKTADGYKVIVHAWYPTLDKGSAPPTSRWGTPTPSKKPSRT